MAPDDTFVMAVNRALQDPDVRSSIRQMHVEGYPLVKMVEALGLEEDMPNQIRDILESLPASVIAGIRGATLQMLGGTEYAMPLRCVATTAQQKSGDPLDVNVNEEKGQLTIRVEPKPTASS